MIRFLVLFFFFLYFNSYSQKIAKENLTKKYSFYWDFYKTKPQSIGSYYKDLLGETTLKHGKWEYFDEQGNTVEIRNYYKDKLNGKLSMFYPNGKPRYEGYFKNDLQDSIYQEWYENGNLAIEATYKNDKYFGFKKTFYVDGRQQALEEYIDSTRYMQEFWLPDSLHTQTVIKGDGVASYFHTTGQIKEWYTYKNGLPDGEFIERSIYGYDLITGFFNHGKKTGEWKYYYYTGDLEKKCSFENDKLNGEFEYYYDKNRINVEGYYKNGLKTGVWTWFTNQGIRDMCGTFKEGKQDGLWTYWYPTGELSYTAYYKEDKKHGTWSYFYKNGAKFKKGDFSEDEKHGKWETWYENGVLLMTGDYHNGKEHGEWLNYWENGKLKNRSTFKKGELNGQWESYFPTGKLKLLGFYKNGFKNKIWTEFFENGSPKDLITYKVVKKKSKIKYGPMKGHYVYESVKDGKSISFSNKDFKKTEEGTFKNGEKHGTWSAYYPGGKITANTQGFKNGKLDGKMKEFDRKGLIISEVDYKDGLKHGKFIIYDKKGKVKVEKKFEYGIQIIEGTKGAGGFSPWK
jgi:antitoxin component YwqK of YwqJK toxin-antitoxin module